MPRLILDNLDILQRGKPYGQRRRSFHASVSGTDRSARLAQLLQTDALSVVSAWGSIVADLRSVMLFLALTQRWSATLAGPPVRVEKLVKPTLNNLQQGIYGGADE